MKNQEEKFKNVLKTIQDEFGEESIFQQGNKQIADVEVTSTGSPSLDIALGVGGIPKGRITEIYGPESAGKTTLALHVVAEMQKSGGMAAYVDVEHALDLAYAKKIGVNTKNLFVSQPDTGEAALDLVEALINTDVDIIVIDSVAALIPEAELEGQMGQSHMGLQARLMSQALRKLTGIISKNNTTVIFINQIRMKIGVVWGNPETTTGGNALKFYSSIRIDVRRASQIKQKEEIIGNRVRAKIVKNKVAPPFQKTEFDIMYNQGISYEGDLIDLGVHFGIIAKAGSWFQYENEKLGQGREAAKDAIMYDNEMSSEILTKIKEKTK